MRSVFLTVVLLAAVTGLLPFSTPEAKGAINISGESRTNPKICFRGIPGNADMTRQITSFLKACGWFDVVDDPKAEYELTGSYAGGKTTISLSMSGAPVGAWTVAGNQWRQGAKVLVDAILKKLFNLNNICQTKIAFCADTARGIKEIYLCDIDGGDVRQLTFAKSLCVEPCWFPGGNSIGYTHYGSGNTNIVETRLTPSVQSRRLVSFNGLNTGVAISPDSSRMAMILSFDHLVDLYVRPVSGGKPVRLTKGRAVEASPCWSPDGKQICFVSDESGRPRLYVVPANGGVKKQLPSVGSEAVTPDWASNGQIVYATRVGGAYTLAVLDLKTGENTRATMVPGTWESPAWGPDNRQVVCKRSDGARSSLFVVDTWTGKVRQLIATKNALSMPSWSKVN
ncbi:MAG: PD40 domain-containing protein [Lentisphaeria bacterium]|nr:PD40 domain-containing protein [Lentisphaeria bacterium]